MSEGDDELREAAGDEPEGRGLDRTRIDDSVHEAFNPAPMVFGRGPDGLPSPQLPAELPLAPPLALGTFVCLGDTSEFVIRDRWGDVVARFKPELVERADGGEYWVTVENALLARAPLGRVLRAAFDGLLAGRVRVEPVRPQCRFLAQQMSDFQDAPEHQSVERLCTARRDSESFFVGLRDTQVHACELREPRDPGSLMRLERFNLVKIKLGRERVEQTGEKFDVDAALSRAEERADENLAPSSIFSNRR